MRVPARTSDSQALNQYTELTKLKKKVVWRKENTF